jgi:O-antigen/teichoic acid export membrane protein
MTADTSNYHGRAQERHRRLLFTTAASVGARMVSLIAIVISVPLSANYLGVERYGLWATIGSLLALMAFADLGIGSGLLNAIAECHGRNDDEGARRYVASAFVMLTGIAVFVGLLFAVVYPWLPWQRIFNVSDPLAVAEAGPATAAVFACFLANIPLNVIQRVQQGYQEGFVDSAWLAAGKLLSLAGLLIVVWLRGGLPLLVLAVAGLPVLVTCINGIALFGFRKPVLRPRLADVQWSYTKRILDTGFLFFVIQIAAAVAFSTDSLILAHMIGPSAVAEYAIIYQMFSLGPILLSMFLNALWPAYGEAIVRGDSHWIRSAFRRSMGVGLAVNVPCALALMFFGNMSIHIWVGNRFTVPFLVLVAFAVWAIMSSFNGAIAVFLNGVNAMRFQAICGLIMAGVNVAVSIVLTKMIGLSGVIWGSIIAQSLVVFIPSSILISRLMQRLMMMEPPRTEGTFSIFEAK